MYGKGNVERGIAKAEPGGAKVVLGLAWSGKGKVAYGEAWQGLRETTLRSGRAL